MTPEQFVYWLSGYLGGIKHDDERLTPLIEVLEE